MKFCSAKNSNQDCFTKESYKWLDGSRSVSLAPNERVSVMLADGSSVHFRFRPEGLENSRCIELFVDTNGHKKPNTIGRDLFDFNFYPQTGEFLPFGTNVDNSYDSQTGTYQKHTDEEIVSNCFTSGWMCASKIISDGFKINY